ncbi:MAG TPA: penicillin-binding protein 2 [Acidimicrobiales bacterium]|nr:penicillin-binding protein 2 [Acidimicrobiales bacterium]
MSSQAETPSAQVRLTVLAVVIVCLFAALFARLWFLQVINEPKAQAAAQDNSVRIVYTPAPRGRILDRNGQVLVDNTVSEVVTLSRVTAKAEPDIISRLALLLNVSNDELLQKVNDPRYSPYVPVPLAVNVQPPIVVYLREHQSEFPGVQVLAVAERYYPYGTVAANIIGYVGQISGQELTATRKRQGYQPDDQIGKTGVEAAYEDALRGQPGVTKLQVDSKGRVLGTLASQPPVQGRDVWLTVDINVQKLAEESLNQGLIATRLNSDRGSGGPGHPFAAPGGAAVVMNPQDGSVLALASNPTYNPQDFVGGISQAKFTQYLNDPGHPLNDRSIQGLYAPGSTFKLVTAVAGLQSGIINPTQYFNDRGFLQLGKINCAGKLAAQGCFYNDNHLVFGQVNLSRAITVSSDAFFYQIGATFWNDRSKYGADGLQGVARQLGFGSTTGIPLPNEVAGRIPDQASRAKEHAQYPNVYPTKDWFTGDNVNTSIGQGEVAVTPLQLANAYATFANGGTVWTPQIASKITDQHGKVLQTLQSIGRGHVAIQPDWRDAMLTGFEGVVASGDGTAHAAFTGFPLTQFPVAGKTGTAQVQGKDPTSVFASFAPANNPQFVVDAVMEESGYGADAAAPVVRRIYDGLFNLTPGQVVIGLGGKD